MTSELPAIQENGDDAVLVANGGTHRLHDATQGIRRLLENAGRFLWDGLIRSRTEMEELVAQSERGLAPGCAECDRVC